MIKHDNDCYWDCSCRRFPTPSGEILSDPDDDCEPLHYKHVKLINDIQQIIKYVESGEDEGDTVDYMINMLKKSLNEAGD